MQEGPAIVTRDELLALGWSPRQIAAAVRAGSMLRLRRAWYCRPGVPFEQRIAIALGGRVGAVSAARSFGMWTGLDDDIHVSWSPHGNVARPGRRLQYPVNKALGELRIVPHWRKGTRGPESWRESPLEAIRQTFLACDRMLGVAMADSGRRLGLVSVAAVHDLLRTLPARLSIPAAAVDGLTDSGLESIVRLWLLEHGILHRLHARLAGLEVDFLIGRSLVIETDGRHYHEGTAFEIDRERDRLLGTHGYVTIRLSYRQITGDWPGCAARIRAALERGDHLRTVTA